MQAHDLDGPNLNILQEPRGKPRLYLCGVVFGNRYGVDTLVPRQKVVSK